MIFDRYTNEFGLQAAQIKKEAAFNIREMLADCAEGNKTIPLSAYSKEQLDDCLNATEILNSFLRNEIYSKGTSCRISGDWYPEEYDSIPVDIIYADHIIRIFVPMTLRRNISKRKRLGIFTKYKLYEYEKTQGIDFSEEMSFPVSVFVYRHVKKISIKDFDNDNNEDTSIINSIFEVLGHSDNPQNMRTYTNAVKEVGPDGTQGVEFIICPQEAAGEIIRETCSAESHI